jgi:hypothetical protein
VVIHHAHNPLSTLFQKKGLYALIQDFNPPMFARNAHTCMIGGVLMKFPGLPHIAKSEYERVTNVCKDRGAITFDVMNQSKANVEEVCWLWCQESRGARMIFTFRR